ncbi:neuronal membrane glycoprotein M6-b isoform X4 [Ovis aries]|uniref:neuronal membrane glycoprotein M6-b isoform X4 n=1 Tax=Ovis aries TaxID=9940 RepID=UPI002952802E|nr:neuronal membrane glycoprotein M6-b isoform X4 [Ovis aries]
MKPAMETAAEENTEQSGERKGCFECCIKCLGGVPYASLVATILCFSGVALFCGCGHVALAGTVAILEQHFSTNTSDHALLSEVIQLMQYVIYGIASFFFLYGIILLAEGFYTTSAVKELHGEFKTTACGRCISGMFVFLTYVLGVAWLGVFGFSAVPVFMFYNIWSTCEVIKSPQTNGTAGVEQICVDIRQYGIIPWNAFPGRICGSALENICNTNEFYMSYHLFIVACAGAGATVIALVSAGPLPAGSILTDFPSSQHTWDSASVQVPLCKRTPCLACRKDEVLVLAFMVGDEIQIRWEESFCLRLKASCGVCIADS